MAMAANSQFRTRQATIFTSYIKTFYEGTIKGKLERYGVEPVKVIDPNKSSSYDMSAAPYVIVLLELMDPKEAKKIREEAKRVGKRCIVLHRQIRDWDKAFNELEQQEIEAAPPPSKVTSPPPLRALPPPPPSEPEPKEEEIEDESEPGPEYKEFLELYEQENKELIAEKKALEAKVSQLEASLQWAASQSTDRITASRYNELARKLKSAEEELMKLRPGLEKTKLERDQITQAARTANLQRDEQIALVKKKTLELEKAQGELTRAKSTIVDLEEQLDAGANTLRVLQQQLEDTRQQKANEGPENLRRELEAYKTGQEKLSKDLLQAQELVKKQTNELFTLRKENKELRANPRLGVDDAELSRLRKENEQLKTKTTVRSTEDFLKLREALATVWRLGAMSDRDVLEKLMNWKPKED